MFLTSTMQFMTPRPLEDDAWRSGDTGPGVAHCYGWGTERDGRSKCWASVAVESTRQATEDDALCPDCETWYWERVIAVPGSLGPAGIDRLGLPDGASSDPDDLKRRIAG
jgi:hypothetical protein